MTSILKVEDIYNDVAIACGFPTYTNDTDTPDITRFLLQMISDGLTTVIDQLSTNNAALNLENKIVTIKGQDKYAVDGIIKHIEIKPDGGEVRRLFYADNIDFMRTRGSKDPLGIPRMYVIDNGYLRLFPCPDKAYPIRMQLSTDDLVLADNDVYKKVVTHINDSIIGTVDFGTLVKLKTIAFVLMRCQSPNAKVYAELANSKMNTFIEKTYGSNEAARGFDRSAGHYNARRGLLG